MPPFTGASVRSFWLAPNILPLTFQHQRPDIIELYKSSFDFAGPCVFVENSWLNHFTEAYRSRLAFIPKLQPQFASFNSSTAHPSALEYSSRSSCGSVDAKGTLAYTAEIFLRVPFPPTAQAKPPYTTFFAKACGLAPQSCCSMPKREFRIPRVRCRFHALPTIETKAGTGILTSLPSDTPFGFFSGTRLTLIRLTLIRNP